MKPVTVEMIEAAAARAKENGHDLRQWTAHKVAYDLMTFDAEFEGVDYTDLVSKVRLWQVGLT